MRLVKAAGQVSSLIEQGARPFAWADYMRAAYAGELAETLAGPDDLEGETAPSPDGPDANPR